MKLSMPRPNRDFGLVDALGVAGLVGLLVARYVPVAKLLPFWGCILRERTGWPCLGCGLTRVAERVSHGELAGAWEANPLGTVAALGFAGAAVLMALHLAFKLPVPQLELSEREALAARLTALTLVMVNYAWVVVKTRFPEWL